MSGETTGAVNRTTQTRERWLVGILKRLREARDEGRWDDYDAIVLLLGEAATGQGAAGDSQDARPGARHSEADA